MCVWVRVRVQIPNERHTTYHSATRSDAIGGARTRGQRLQPPELQSQLPTCEYVLVAMQWLWDTTHTNTHTHARTHTRKHTHTHKHTNTSTHTQTYPHTRKHR